MRVPAADAAQADGRLVRAVGDELASLYRIIWLVGDGDIDEDEVVEWLTVMSAVAEPSVLPGRERAWLLRSLLRVLGALHDGAGVQQHPPGGRRRRERELPQLGLREGGAASHLDIPVEALVRVQDAWQEVDRPTRAAVLLVVHEGLSIEDAVKVQGGTKGAFTRRYAQGMALLDDELIDAMLGRGLSQGQG